MTRIFAISAMMLFFAHSTVPPQAGDEECGTPAVRVSNAAPIYDLFSDYSEILRTAVQQGRFVLFVSKHAQSKTGDRVSFFRSETAGVTWLPSTEPARNVQVIGMKSYNAGAGIIYKFGTRQAFKSTDGGSSWQPMASEVEGLNPSQLASPPTELGKITVIPSFAGGDPANPLTIFAGLALAVPDPQDSLRFSWYLPLPGVYVSRDGGNHWSLFSSGLRQGALVAVNPSNPRNIISVATNGVVSSQDGGVSWQPIPQQRTLEAPAPVTTAVPIPDPKVLTKEEKEYYERVLEQMKLRLFQVAFTESGDIYLLSNKGLYRLKSGRSIWRWLEIGSPRLAFGNSIAINPLNPAEIFVGTDAGIKRSTDNGCHFKTVLH